MTPIRVCKFWLVLIVLFSTASFADKKNYSQLREEMVQQQLKLRGVKDPLVLAAMHRVERQKFVDATLEEVAYDDRPLPIGYEQTISQPYIVGVMTELLQINKQSKVLEVGTGSGYQAAILAEICAHVYTVEIIKELADLAEARLKLLGYKNISFKRGDGYEGWQDFAPFDAIVVTAAPDTVPPHLIDQLKPGGRLVIPVGEKSESQELILIEKSFDGSLHRKNVMPVRFVPLKKKQK